jgi:hypothetical protein
MINVRYRPKTDIQNLGELIYAFGRLDYSA